VTAFICAACGTEFPASTDPPAECPICTEERQFVPAAGQRWTTLEDLAADHANAFRQHEPGVVSVTTTPAFGIGERALLVLTEHGNLLWDCVALLDDATITLIQALGGLAAIAISHPHFYTTMNRWAEAFEAPVYLHAADRRWVMASGDRLVFCKEDRREILPGMNLIHCGGHFAGGTVLHWRSGAEGRGVLFSGDILQVLPDRRHVSFMRSYPNLMPLSAAAVERIVAPLASFRFQRIYGAFAEREILSDADEAVRRSADRYVRAVSGHGPADAER
jgi:hypothetical protein